MNWKRELVDSLKEYVKVKKNISHVEKRVVEINRELEAIGKVKKYGSTTDIKLCLMAELDFLEENRARTIEFINKMDEAFAILPEKQRNILSFMYLEQEKGGIERVCKEFNYQPRNAYYIVATALNELGSVYFLADQKTAGNKLNSINSQ